MAKIDFGPIYGPDIEEATIQLKMIMDAKDDTDEWKQWAAVAKKSLERSLYRYVINGCVKEGRMLNAYPELKTQYDPDSTDLLDEKIKVLLKIAASIILINLLQSLNSNLQIFLGEIQIIL